MSDSAIQPDVQTEVTGKETSNQPVLSARELAMKQIMDSRISAFEKESGIKIERSAAEDPPKSDDDLDKDQDDAAAEAERQRLAQMDEDDGKKEPPKAEDIFQKKVPVKINGEEGEVTVEEMRRSYQKSVAADRRLEELARRERELAEREAQIAAQIEVAKKPENKEPDAVVDPQVAKKFTSALFDGDEEKAVAAFNAAVQSAVEKATQGRQSATPDIDEITATVEQRFAVNSALKKSKTDYPEMYADSDIESLAAMKIRAKREEGMTFQDALEETGREFAEKFGWKKSGRKEQTESTTRDEKLKRKAELDPIESANVKSSTTEIVPLTHSQIIAQMAARRPGQGG